MNRVLSVVTAVVVGSGCASSQDALVKRREQIRAVNGEVMNLDVNRYRGTEGVRGAVWGMTEDQVIAVKGEPAEKAPELLMYLDDVDGQQTPSTYFFFQGHLAQVKSRFEADQQASERLSGALTLKWGQPVSDFDKARAAQEAIDSSRRWDYAALAVGATLLTGVAVAAAAGHGGGHVNSGAGFYPWGFAAADNRALIESQMLNADRPSRDVLWATHESRVHLVTLSTGLSEVTWSSLQLGNKLVRQQMSKAGLEKLSDAL